MAIRHSSHSEKPVTRDPNFFDRAIENCDNLADRGKRLDERIQLEIRAIAPQARFQVTTETMGKTYKVEIIHQGTSHTIEVPEDKQILRAAYGAGLMELPSSCNAGVCTTCAAKIIGDGKVDQTDGMGVGTELQAEGYVLLCVAYPRSDLKIETEKEDEVYDRQFGH